MRPNYKLRDTAISIILLYAISFWPLPGLAQKQGQALIDSMNAALPKLRADTAAVKFLNRLAQEYREVAPDEGIRIARRALALSEKLSWDRGRANSYNCIGICALYQSEYDTALAYWLQSKALFEHLGDKHGILKPIGNMGIIYTYRGDYLNAQKLSFQALKYAEELNDTPSIEIYLGNIGSNYEYLNQYDKALEYDQKTLAYDKMLHDTASMATTLGNIGNIYSDLRRYREALQYDELALQYEQRLGNTEGIARNLINLGGVYNNLKAPIMALDHLFKALKLSQASGLQAMEPRAYREIGATLISVVRDTTGKQPLSFPSMAGYMIPPGRAGILRAAIGFLKKSNAIFLKKASLDDLMNNYALLAEAQRLNGDFQSAFFSVTEFMRYKDSVFSTESKINIAKLETQRALELKDKQIIIDRLEVAKKRNERVLFGAGFVLLLVVVLIMIRNIRLSTAKELSENKLNAFQARMNPHFIFNSLSSIQALILNNETEQSIDYLAEFSTLMRQILDNSGQSKVTLQTEITMLRSYIELEHLRFDGFQRTITIPDAINPESVHVPGMVIQPFVENAILHGLVSKGAEGRLDITFAQDDRHIICTVEDNGVGRARSAEINRKRSKTRQSHGTAIAINRLLLLADKKRGLTNEVHYIDKVEGGVAAGTKVIIQLPVL